jgi:L-fucose isomerase-like protein
VISLELTLILPKKLERKLKEECERSGASIEELALEALCRGMDEEIDPSDRAELYARLSEKYLREAEDLLSKDHVQASEKLWGAAALMVKAVAASRGISISSHELFSFVRRLGEEERNPELRRLFSVASTLHQNFYENWLRGDVVREYSEDVKQLVAELKKLIRTSNRQKGSDQ